MLLCRLVALSSAMHIAIAASILRLLRPLLSLQPASVMRCAADNTWSVNVGDPSCTTLPDTIMS